VTGNSWLNDGNDGGWWLWAVQFLTNLTYVGGYLVSANAPLFNKNAINYNLINNFLNINTKKTRFRLSIEN